MRQTILILAANPKDTERMRLDEEVREIQAGLERAKQRDQFVLEQKWAVRPRDIQRAMLDLNPQIIHFSGHGTRDEGLVFEDETGSAKLVDGEALAKLFQLFADKVKCVVLNGCYSEVQAEAIAQHINYVIGMKKAIGDKAAIQFAVGFYDALGNGRSVAFAYNFGCAAIGLAGLTEQLTPILKKRPNGEELSPSSKEDTPEPDKPKHELVQTVRKNISDWIHLQCASMRVLDMDEPIGLDDIYTKVNILKKITARKRREMSEILQSKNKLLETSERISLRDDYEKRVPGLEAVNKHSKLIILGKPGAGKTTFLKYLALQCIEGKFQSKQIPIFITLKEFAEAHNQPALLNYLENLFMNYSGIKPNIKVKNRGVHFFLNPNSTVVEQLLQQGKLLMLFDGLDEVRETDSSRVLKEIKDFTDQFHNNQFVISCRIAAREYTFEKFTEVEIADFDDEQIAQFANKWFQYKTVKADLFIENLKKSKPIQELASNPLLLTLLCLVFEESGNFPQNRSELYKEGLDVLLKKWDAKRNIQRDQAYKKLSLKRKEDLLSKLAFSTFKDGNYFFKQNQVEQYIVQYIKNLPDASIKKEDLQLDSEAVLKSIEAQHGLLVERAKSIFELQLKSVVYNSTQHHLQYYSYLGSQH